MKRSVKMEYSEIEIKENVKLEIIILEEKVIVYTVESGERVIKDSYIKEDFLSAREIIQEIFQQACIDYLV